MRVRQGVLGPWFGLGLCLGVRFSWALHELDRQCHFGGHVHKSQLVVTKMTHTPCLGLGF